jgi:hypothetical protein
MVTKRVQASLRVCLLMLLGLLPLSGCNTSGLYPVHGKVTFPDGSPLDDGMVICELQDGEVRTTARANLRKDGSFELGTYKPGDGALPGKYRVQILARELSPEYLETNPPIIDLKYEKFATSGLTLEVLPQSNEVNFAVTKSTTWKPRPASKSEEQ